MIRFRKSVSRATVVAAIMITTLVLSTLVSIHESSISHIQGSPIQKIGGYTTYYQDSSQQRVNNIKLASTPFNNITVMTGETISFNSLVGARSAERGYMSANIIVDGEFKEGIGGGVCQVSTTLYNAWLTSGLEVVSFRAHSLPVGYIAMSRDAAVSSTIDLVLRNNSADPVVIVANAESTSVSIALYGKPNEYRYNIVCKTIRELSPIAPEEIYSADYPIGQIIETKKPRMGYITQAIIEKYKGDQLISTKQEREDTYQPVRGKITRGGVSPT